MMRNYVYSVVIASVLMTSGLGLADQPIDPPRQFTTWAKQAPKDWRQRAVPPAGWEEVDPKDNFLMPSVDESSRQRGWVVFTKPAFELVFPHTAPFSGDLSETLRAFGCPGQYVPITFCVRSLRALKDFTVTLGPLKNKDGREIPPSHIELRVVRCLPAPANLVDPHKAPEGITVGEKKYVVTPAFIETLSAENIPDETTQQFWLTVHIPVSAAAGIYEATITLKDAAGKTQAISLRLRVMPFTLREIDPKRMVFSILYNGTDPRKKTHGEGIYPENLPKHFIDMAEHGLNSTGYLTVNPNFEEKDGKLVISFDEICVPSGGSTYTMDDVMRHYQEAGFTGPLFHQKGPFYQAKSLIRGKLGYKQYTPEFDDAFRQLTLATAKRMKEKGWPELIFVMGDEPGSSAERQKLHSYYVKIVKEVAPDIRTSNFFNGDWGGTKDWLILKDNTDICCSNYFTEEVMEERRQAGYKEFWSYNGASGASFTPLADRLFYGFHPWKIGVSGVTQYLYQKITGDPFNHLDLPPKKTRISDYIYPYPTPEGPLPSLCWEAVREGVYDWQYLWTLEGLIEQARKSPSQKVKTAADNAQKEMDDVMNNFSYNFQSPARKKLFRQISPLNLDVYRWRITRTILQLQEAMDKHK